MESLKSGNFFIKLTTQQMVYVLNESKAQYFNDLLSGNANSNNDMGYFSLENDAIELAEAGFKTDPDENDEKINIFCWGRRGASGNSPKWGLYFLDESDPEYSTFSYCINGQTQGDPPGVLGTNTRLNIKLTYLKLGVYFTLYAKAKLQRESGKYIVNEDPFWTTTNWGTAEGRWSLDYKVKYRREMCE